jgi:cytochrome P450
MKSENLPGQKTNLPFPTLAGEDGLQTLRAIVQHRSLLAGLEVMHAQLGSAFQISLPRFNPIVLSGPELNRQILVAERELFLWRNERDPVTHLLRHGILVEDGDSHDHLKSLMDPSLRRARAYEQIEAMWRYTDLITSRWVDGDTEDMLVQMRGLALVILFGTLFGVEVLDDLDRLWGPILKVIRYISPGLWLVFPGAPRPGYQGAIQELDDYLYELIAARRQAATDSPDLLSRLAAEPEMTPALIRDQLLTMLIAGHDTSTALLAWALYLFGEHPDALARARDEVDQALAGDPPNHSNLAGLQYLDQVIKETLRLYPPIHVGNRMTNTPVQVNDYLIPEGQRVMYSIYLTHRDPQHWPDADQFKPERFSPRAERTHPAFSYVPFGGGPRPCIGAAFAQVEAKVVLARLLQTFDFVLLPGKVYRHMGATLEPHPGVRMRVVRRSANA